MNPIDSIREAGRRLLVMEPNDLGQRMVYGVRRLLSVDLAGLPSVDLANARDEQSYQEEEDARLLGAHTEADAERIKAEIAAMKLEQNRRVVEELAADDRKAHAFQVRCERIVCATVEAVGFAADGVPSGVVEPGTSPSEVCEAIDDDGKTFMVPVRFVTGDPGPGELSIRALAPLELMALGGLISRAFSVRREVTPFPGRTGATAAGGSTRQAVQGASKRVPAGPGRAGGRAGPRGDAGR